MDGAPAGSAPMSIGFDNLVDRHLVDIIAKRAVQGKQELL